MASKPIKSIFDPDEADEKPAVKKKAGDSASKKATASKKSASGGQRKAHKYGRNQGEGLSSGKAKYTPARYNKLFKTERYTRKTVQRDREYGIFWYDWLWHILRPFMLALCVCVVVAGVVMALWNWTDRHFFAPVDAGDGEEITFVVASGSSLTRVANNLEDAGLIHNRTVFKYYADFLGYGQKIQSGEYMISRSMSMRDIMELLTTGDGNPITRNITVIPGWTVQDIAAYLKEQGAIQDEAAFLSLCRTGLDFSAYYYVADVLASAVTVGWISDLLNFISLYRRFAPFARGQLSLSNALYNVLFMGVMLFLSVRVLDARISEDKADAFSVVVCDVNGLKAINDSQGHIEGDAYIRNACMLICHIWAHSPVFRIGGDEFAVVLQGEDYAQRDALLASLKNRVLENRENGSVVIAAGMADYEPDRDASTAAVFERADSRMYENKSALKV